MLDSLGCALYGADLEWSRILQDSLVESGLDPRVRGLGNEEEAVGAARGARQRHRGAGLRARRRAPRRRAARGRGGAARADPHRRDEPRHERQGIPDRRGRRLRDRPARRALHGARAHRSGLALRRDTGRVLRRGGRGARPRAGCRENGPRAGHRRHPGRGPDGGAVRGDGEAHARRPLVAERAVRRAAREGRIHRHRQRPRKRVRRLLHHASRNRTTIST